MKKLTLIFTLLFSTVMFPSASFAEWTKVSTSVDGDEYYVDFERIRKADGYVFYWVMYNFIKPSPSGNLSDRTYTQGDCKYFRSKWLSILWHKEPLGQGFGESKGPVLKEHQSWKYPPPNSTHESILKSVCDYVK